MPNSWGFVDPFQMACCRVNSNVCFWQSGRDVTGFSSPSILRCDFFWRFRGSLFPRKKNNPMWKSRAKKNPHFELPHQLETQKKTQAEKWAIYMFVRVYFSTILRWRNNQQKPGP